MSLSFNLSKAHSPQHCLRIHHQLYAVISVIEEDCMIRISTTKWGKTIFLSFLTLNFWVISTDWFEFIALSLVPLSPLSLSQVRMLYLNLHRDFWWEEAEKLPQLETTDSYLLWKKWRHEFIFEPHYSFALERNLVGNPTYFSLSTFHVAVLLWVTRGCPLQTGFWWWLPSLVGFS